MFTYSPLSREKRETRVFRFSSPRQSGSDRISLELGHASLDDDSLQYRALSYVWGDTKNKEDIEVNGKLFSVGENLHALLQTLQHHGVESWLWADAICIQQSDDDEKSWHVQSMCDIFKNGEFVYSWLGPGSEATDVAMDFFSDWGPRALKVGVMEKLWPTYLPTDACGIQDITLSTPSHIYIQRIRRYFFPKPVFEKESTVEDASSTNHEWYDLARFLYDLLHVEGLHGTHGKFIISDLEAGITNLLTKEYWHRIWIFQEVALAREVLLMCGEKFTPISYFEAVLEALWKFCGGFPMFFHDFPLRHGFCEQFPSHLYPNKAILVRQLLCRGGKVSLGTLLLAFSDKTERPLYRATDPRDIVYGILGLLSNDDRHSFGNVDYTNTSWVDLFTQATRSLIKASLTSDSYARERVYTIGHCLPRPRDQPSELPSWVPDWRDVGIKGLPQSLVDPDYSFHDASDSRWSTPYPILSGHDKPSAIKMPGYCVDVVTDVMEYDNEAKNLLEKDRPSDWLARIRGFTKLSKSSDVRNMEGEDYVWRLMLCFHHESFLGSWLNDRPDKTEAAFYIRRLMRQDYPDPQTFQYFLFGSLPLHISQELMVQWKITNSKDVPDTVSSKIRKSDDDTSRDATVVVDGKAQMESKTVDPKCLPGNESISERDVRLFMDGKIRELFLQARSKNSTLFKTAKEMLGIGIGDVRPGDMVVILQNAHVPFILRPRPQDGDGIATNSGGSGSTFTFGGEAWVDGIMFGEFMKTNPKEEIFDIY
ncbi:heterokaryon incompatibility protein domain-containing protein [Neurospora intermedia]|uniref:Heterokaryon incompatibility protein domain-containing protein n=1 Tax=Neurospora intermedia TaxID=5142 RepID=A0ABR3D9X2_NEUIN